MSQVGADVEQLAGLGTTMKQQKVAIDGVISVVSSALANTLWTGPAHDRFETDWNTTFRNALNRLNEAFEAAGTGCINRSRDLQQLMSC